MGELSDRIRRLLTRRRPIRRDEAEDISRWVSEGGTYDPTGPPPVEEERDDPERQ